MNIFPICTEIQNENLTKLMEKFAALELDVINILEKKKIQFNTFCHSANHFFPAKVIGRVQSIPHYLEKTRENNILNPLNYRPLKSILKVLLRDDPDFNIDALFNNYIDDLCNYLNVTRIMDFLRKNDKEYLLYSGDATPLKEGTNYCDELIVKIKNVLISEKFMNYIQEIWDSFLASVKSPPC